MTTSTTEQATVGEELERVTAAARDSLSDEIVSRLAGSAPDALDLIDRFNRSGLSSAIPALAEMVNNGDLDRLVKFAHLYTATEDAVTDEMVGRLGDTIGHGMSLLDQVKRRDAKQIVSRLDRLGLRMEQEVRWTYRDISEGRGDACG